MTSSRTTVPTPALETRVATLPCWRTKVRLEPLRGGLSNVAFVVDDAGERFVVRCGDDIPIHHVFRARELAACIAAHAVGLSPELTYAERGIMVIRHIAGRTLVEVDLAANVARIVPLLKACHRDIAHHIQGPANLFWVFHVTALREDLALELLSMRLDYNADYKCCGRATISVVAERREDVIAP